MRTVVNLASLLVAGQLLSGCGGAFHAQEPPNNAVMFIRNTTALNAFSPSDKFEPYPLPILQPGQKASTDAAPYVLVPKSINEPPGASAVKTAAVGTVTLADVNTAPYDNFVKLRFKEGTTNYQCTAEFVGDSYDVLVTAAHCVYSNTLNAWSSSWRAYTKYDQGNYQADFNWECVATYSGWAKRNYPYDYAFIKLRGKNPTALGMRGAALPNEWKSVGYPSNFYSGERLVQVDGTNGGASGGVVRMANNPFSRGSSGGAWIVDGTAIGLNSFNYTNDPNSMWGPQFDVQTIELYEFVRRGCVSNEVAVKRAPSPPSDKAVYIEVAKPNSNLAPTIVYSVDKRCPCNDGRLAKIINPTASRYTSTLAATVFQPTSRSETIQTIHTEILPGESRELGCTVGELDATSCDIGNSYSITGMRKIHASVDASGVRSLRTVSPDFCSDKCSDSSSIG